MSDNALSAAILSYDAGRFEALLSDASSAALAHTADSNARTPLQIAAEHGQTEMLRRLLTLHSVQASIDVAEPIEQRTALMFAVASGAQACVALLLDHGANLHARNRAGQLCVHLAALNNRVFLLYALLRLAKSAPPRAAESLSSLSAASFDPVRAVDLQGRTPLHCAASVDAGWCVTLLCGAQHGADLAAVDSHKQTALHVAAAGDHEEACRLLVEAGAPLDCRDADGLTPDELARQQGRTFLAIFLQAGRVRGRQHIAPDLTNKPQARHALFVLPSLLIPLGCWFSATYGVLSWQSFLCGFGVLAMLARVRPTLWPERQSRSRFPAGISAAAIFWFVSSHWFVLWPAAAELTLLHALAFAAEAIVICTFVYATLTEPGVLMSRDEFRDVRESLLRGVDDERFCCVCELTRPLRSRHCRLCRVCVSRCRFKALRVIFRRAN